MFSDSFVTQQQPQSQAVPAPPPSQAIPPPPQSHRPPVKSSQLVADVAPPPPSESTTTTRPKLAQFVQKSAPDLLGPDPGAAEQPSLPEDSGLEEDRMEETREGHSSDPVLVAIEENSTGDSGPLVHSQSPEIPKASAEIKSKRVAVPAAKTREPAIGQIISIDPDSEEELEEDENTSFFQRRKRTSSEGTVQKDLVQEPSSSKQLAVGPVRRSKSLRHTPSHPDPLVDSHRVSPEDGGHSPGGETETTPIITLDLSSSKPAPHKGSRPAAPGVDKSKYTSLGSPPSSPTGSSPQDGQEGTDSRLFARGSESPMLSMKERGHARSTSLDLKKMLQEGGDQGEAYCLPWIPTLTHVCFLTTVHTGLPSAVPPKPPPVSWLSPTHRCPSLQT